MKQEIKQPDFRPEIFPPSPPEVKPYEEHNHPERPDKEE